MSTCVVTSLSMVDLMLSDQWHVSSVSNRWTQHNCYCMMLELHFIHLVTLDSVTLLAVRVYLAVKLRLWFNSSVTVTEALVLRPLLEDRGRITESIRILVPVNRMIQKCFQITTKQVRWSKQFRYMLFLFNFANVVYQFYNKYIERNITQHYFVTDLSNEKIKSFYCGITYS